MQKWWMLAVSFTIIGIGAYGGGIVTVPLMQHELVTTRALLSMQEISQIVAIAQMTPGPIAVNAATFVGYRVASIGGALLATGVVVLPGMLALGLLSHFYPKEDRGRHFRRLRRGVRAGVLSLLLFATWSYGRGVVTGLPELAIAAGSFLCLLFFSKKVHPLAVIAAGGVVGLIIFG